MTQIRVAALPRAAQELIARHFGAAAQVDILPVHGTTNFVARLEVGSEYFALRAPRVPDALTLVDRRSERCILEVAARCGIAPQLVAVDEASGALLTRWIEGDVWTPARARETDSLRVMATLLRTLHGLPVPAEARRLHLEDLIERYLARLEAGTEAASARPPQVREVVEHCLALRSRALARLRGLPVLRRALCHNDAQHRNIIQAGSRVWLLDWEYAAEVEILFDLAGFASQNELDEPQASRLLDHYGVDATAARSFGDWRWIFDYVALAWLAGALSNDPATLDEAPVAPGSLIARLQ